MCARVNIRPPLIALCRALMQMMLVVSNGRKAAAASSQSKVDDTQLEFSESMRRTQEAVAHSGCLSRWCCRGESQDKYAVDVLTTEIDSLKRTVREVSSSSKSPLVRIVSPYQNATQNFNINFLIFSINVRTVVDTASKYNFEALFVYAVVIVGLHRLCEHECLLRFAAHFKSQPLIFNNDY